MWAKALRRLEQLETLCLVLTFAAMVLLAVWQIIGRNFLGTGIAWGDTFVRVAVLWLTLLGAMIATRKDDHIRIDVLSRVLKGSWQRWSRRFTALFTAAVAFLFCWHAGRFVYLDYQDGIIAFAEVPAWVCEAIMPVAGAVIGLRYLVHAVKPGR